jgi:ABC-2 type transport system permease protein
MSPYWALLQARYRMLLQYRGAAFAGAATQFWWGFIKVMIFEAFYLANAAAAPMGFEAAVTYVWLGQAFLAMLPWNLDRDVVEQVRSGNLSYDLMRPVDLYGFWFCGVLAWRSAGVTLRCLPIFVFSGALLSLTPLSPWALAAPASLTAGLGFVAALAVAFMLSAAITTLAHTALLWTLSGEGVQRILPAFVVVFSGMIVPLPFYPEWSQPFVRALPFRALCDVPYRIYSGHLSSAEAASEIGLALAWTLALVIAGRALLVRGARRVVVQGG